ncbi:hypothetical protein OAG71_00585 [bacterium]|nr:hypothetical protein [bacterium]
MKTYLFIAISVLVLFHANDVLADDHTIAEIKTAWEKTAEATESCRFNWTETRQVGDNTSSSYTYSIFLKNTDHLRLERISKQFDTERNRNITESYVTTFNGNEGRSFYGRDFVDAQLYPTGFASIKHSDWDNYHVLPVLFAVRPVNNQFSPIKNCEYTVAAQTVEVAGRKLLELCPSKLPKESHDVQYVYYVDPKRNFAIGRIVKKLKDRKLWQLDIANSLNETSGCWIPESWELKDESTNLHCVVRDVQVNLDLEFADSQFVFKFPSHTLITDRTFTKPLVYILREDGRKRIIPSEERRNGIHYLDYLAAVGKDPGTR